MQTRNSRWQSFELADSQIRRLAEWRTRAAALVALMLVAAAPSLELQTTNRHVLLVLDGLRPDYVTPDVMPNLHALGRRGVVFTDHHAVYPTVTRVNSSAISTGAYPERHGILGNAVFFPRVDPRRFLDTGQRADLEKIQTDQDGVLLTATTLGDVLQQHGRKLLAVGAGTTGSAFLLNHKVSGGAIIHTDYALPAELQARITAELGPPPPEGRPNDARNRRAVQAFLQIGLPALQPAISIVWLSDPDTTAHALGMGHPTTVDALRRLDREVKNVLDGLAAAGPSNQYNVWVTSDHGFATYTGAPNVAAIVKSIGGALPDGTPRIVHGETAMYVRDENRSVIAQIVAELQKTAGIGAIFTRGATPGSLSGAVAGTLSFEAARWAHARSGDILYSPDWTDGKNEFGFAGTSASNGVAGHGSSSPFEIHNTLIAAGPDLKQGATLDIPSSNVDFAPTFLQMMGLAPPQSMQGRPLVEAMRAGNTPAPAVRRFQHTVGTKDGSYTQTARFSVVRAGSREYRYLDYTTVRRGNK
jgi:predicted AlkP superfamily pyrophosphatase or phosphodiesterase